MPKTSQNCILKAIRPPPPPPPPQIKNVNERLLRWDKQFTIPHLRSCRLQGTAFCWLYSDTPRLCILHSRQCTRVHDDGRNIGKTDNRPCNCTWWREKGLRVLRRCLCTLHCPWGQASAGDRAKMILCNGCDQLQLGKAACPLQTLDASWSCKSSQLWLISAWCLSCACTKATILQGMTITFFPTCK